MAGDILRTMHALALTLCVTTLVACNRDAAPAPAAPKPAMQAKAPVVAKPGPSVEELTAGMVEAVTQGKPQAVIQVKFDLGQKPTVGQPLEVNLALIAHDPVSATTVQITSYDGMDLAPGANQFDFPELEPGEVYRHTLRVTPKTDGVLFIGLNVTYKRDDSSDIGAFSIPIIAER